MKKYYFKVIRVWRGFGEVKVFAFVVEAYNVVAASHKAFERVKKSAMHILDAHNADYDEDHEEYKLLANEDAGCVSIWYTHEDTCLMAYMDFEIISEQEYNSSDYDKTFITI